MKNFFPIKQFNNQFSFCEKDEKHLKQVLRTKLQSEIICIFDNHKYLCTITSLNPLLATIKQALINENFEFKNYHLTLFQALIKPKHFEWILAKANELNLNTFYPVMFSRSQGNFQFKKDRLENIIESSAKQSGRTQLCEVKETIKFSSLLELLLTYDLVLVPYESKQDIILGSFLKQCNLQNKPNIAIVIGPEGGFTHEEISQLSTYQNVQIVSLSKTILRSETAALYTLSILIDNMLLKEKEGN